VRETGRVKEGVSPMARIVVLTALLVTVFTLASPLPSHAGFRSGFVTGFPVATFPRPHFVPFGGGVVVVNRSFVAVSPFVFPARRVFVREVILPRAPVLVTPRMILVSPVFVTPVRRFAPSRCFFDQFGVLRCFP
jgi:hypothetical protein